MSIVQLELPIPQDVTIPLTKGYSTIVSWEDRDLFDIKWCVMTPRNIQYAMTSVLGNNKKKLYLHRVILERIIGRKLVRSEQVDHIDGNGLNNRRDNLRLATNSQNHHNISKRSDNKSGYKGVCYSGGKWVAQINVSGKQTYLGRFDTPENAYEAYCEAAKKYHGEFARIE